MTNLDALKILHKFQRLQLHVEQASEVRDLYERGESNMPVDPKVAEIIKKFDVATDAIAARIQKYIDTGGMNAETEAALTAEVAKLEALGRDPNDPIPANT